MHVTTTHFRLTTMDGTGFGVLLILVLTNIRLACHLSEYYCDNGNCVLLNKYCDGTDDCGDGSDEPLSCTNCNRTYFGHVGHKYPLRMTEPFQRHLPYFCKLTFVANGNEFGDLIELTFLSFQVGTFLIDSSHTSKCQQGYMKVTEKRAIHHKRSQWSSAERLRMPSLARSRPREHEREVLDFGYFCGSMPSRRTSFYSEGSHVSLIIALPSLVSVHSFLPSLYLTYKFLKTSISPTITKKENYYGEKISGTYCNRIFRNCHENRCKIQSPNYPGFYLRNITCNYVINQDKNLRGHLARIVISQKNDYKINLYSGYTDTGGYTLAMLTAECAGDVVRIIDGLTPDMPILAEFCGSGQLPEVISSGPDVLIQLVSAPYQVLHNSKLELDITIKYVKNSDLTANSRGACLFSLDGHRNRTGVIYSPNHTMPPNTTCSYHFRGGTVFDRVWLYFLSYYVPDLHVWSDHESCDVTRLEIYDTSRRSSSSDGTLIGRYCEKSFPRMCPHAVDYGGYVPRRPCNLTAESYISSGSELMLKYTVFQSLDFMSQKSTFLARYEFVNTMQTGYPLNSGACDRRFSSEVQPEGSLGSPHNVFLYGRGGSKHLKCLYQFEGLPTERLKVTLKRVNLGECHSYFDTVTLRHTCNNLKGRRIHLNVTESWHGVHLDAGCICGYHEQSVIIESFSSNVQITLFINEMSPLDDFRNYYFEATYQFLPVEPCGGIANGTKGELIFPVGSDDLIPKRCRWLVEARPLKHLYLKVTGRKTESDCNNGNRYLIYSGEVAQLLATVCAETLDNRTTFDVFSLTWSNSSKKIKTDKFVIDMIATRPGTFNVQWLEVTRPFVYGESGTTLRNKDCVYECPELNACIGADLWCDGTVHCPSGSDEVPEVCTRFPTVYVSVGVSVAFTVILVVTLVLAHKWCRYTNIKGNSSCREEIQMSTTPGTRIGEGLSV